MNFIYAICKPELCEGVEKLQIIELCDFKIKKLTDETNLIKIKQPIKILKTCETLIG